MRNLGLLALRLTVGTLLAGHGAQKLFGVFGGPGLKNTGELMHKLGIRPGGFWGPVAAMGELTGGTLTALGLFHPMGPQNSAAAMTVAIRRAHWGKPIWAQSGGAELPLINLTAAATLMMTGPGTYSLDSLLRIKLPKWFVAFTWIGTIAMTAGALFRPEVVQTVLDRATGGGKAYEGPADATTHVDSTVVTEQRPRAQDPVVTTVQEKVETGI